MVQQLQRRRRHKAGLFNSAAHIANPVLLATKLARGLIRAPNAIHQHGMHLSNQTQTNRTMRNLLSSQRQGFAVIDDLMDVFSFFWIEINSRFELQNFIYRCLRALNL